MKDEELRLRLEELRKEREDDVQYRKKVRVTSYEDFVHQKDYSPVKVIIRKTIGRKKVQHEVWDVEVSLRGRVPNVDNVVLYNLNRALKDLKQIRDDIIKNNLYEDSLIQETGNE